MRRILFDFNEMRYTSDPNRVEIGPEEDLFDRHLLRGVPLQEGERLYLHEPWSLDAIGTVHREVVNDIAWWYAVVEPDTWRDVYDDLLPMTDAELAEWGLTREDTRPCDWKPPDE